MRKIVRLFALTSLSCIAMNPLFSAQDSGWNNQGSMGYGSTNSANQYDNSNTGSRYDNSYPNSPYSTQQQNRNYRSEAATPETYPLPDVNSYMGYQGPRNFDNQGYGPANMQGNDRMMYMRNDTSWTNQQDLRQGQGYQQNPYNNSYNSQYSHGMNSEGMPR